MRVEQLRNVDSIVRVQAFILSDGQKLLFSIVMLVQLRSDEFQCIFVQPNPIESDSLSTERASKVSSDGFQAFLADTMIL